MKPRFSPIVSLLSGAMVLLSLTAFSEVITIDPARLPYGVADVLKLSRAQVSEDVIVTYIENSGTAYNLNANEIVYLRDQGITERVLNVMLDQRKKVYESVAQASQAPASVQAPVAPSTPTYVQTAPVYAAPSTVHVIPYPAASYAYYSSYRPYYSSAYYSPYYGGYYGGGYYNYYRPSVSFSFGFGHGHSGYYGGHHRGSYGGGHGHHSGIHAVRGGSGRHR
jgi:hypothetical protein